MKIKHFPGQTLKADFVNNIQLPIRFDGEPRSNNFSIDQDPSLRWDINQRDGLLDWEVATTTENTVEGGNRLGTLVNSGRAYSVDDGFISDSSINDSYEVIIHQGFAIDYLGEVVSWDTTIVSLTSDTLLGTDDKYIYYDTINNSIEIESVDEYGLNYFRKVYLYKQESNVLIDMRSGLYIDNKSDFSSNQIHYYDSNVIVSSTTLALKTSHMIDSGNGGFVLTLPGTPATLHDGDSVEIIDIGGQLSTNNVTFSSATVDIEDDHELFTHDFGRVIFTYNAALNRWNPLGLLTKLPDPVTPASESHILKDTSFQAVAGETYYITAPDVIMTLPASGDPGDTINLFIDEENPLEVILDPTSLDTLSNNDIGINLRANNSLTLSPDSNWEVHSEVGFTQFKNKMIVEFDDTVLTFTTTSALSGRNEINVIYTGTDISIHDELNPLELIVDDSALKIGHRVLINNLTGGYLKVTFQEEYLMSFDSKDELYLPKESASLVLNQVNNTKVWTYDN